MRNRVLLSLMLVVLSGCAADLRSGRKFEGIQVIEALRRTGQLKAAEAK